MTQTHARRRPRRPLAALLSFISALGGGGGGVFSLQEPAPLGICVIGRIKCLDKITCVFT